MHQIQCSEIWGGVESREEDLLAAGVKASLFSGACEGGKGGDIYYVPFAAQTNWRAWPSATLLDTVRESAMSVPGSTKPCGERMNDPDGAAVLSNMKNVAVERGLDAMTTAAIVGYYKGGQELMFSNAGHPPAWVWRRESGIWQRADLDCTREGPANIPLGIFDDTHFHQTSSVLKSGDRLVVYTDGILETPDTAGNQFGETGVNEVLSSMSAEEDVGSIRRALIGAAHDHAGGDLSHDDVTLLAVEVV